MNKSFAAIIALLAGILLCAPLVMAGAEWHTVTGHDGAFTVEMPSAPRHVTDVEKTETGGAILKHFYLARRGAELFVASVAIYPAELDLSQFRPLMQRALEAVGPEMLASGKWDTITFFHHHGYPGVSGIGVTKDGNSARLVVIQKGNKAYSMLHTGTGRDFQRFFETLRIR